MGKRWPMLGIGVVAAIVSTFGIIAVLLGAVHTRSVGSLMVAGVYLFVCVVHWTSYFNTVRFALNLNEEMYAERTFTRYGDSEEEVTQALVDLLTRLNVRIVSTSTAYDSELEIWSATAVYTLR
jgi:hypothetical protein